jgi:transmembrane sensor
MKQLPDPLRKVLDTASTEGEILGVWRGVQRKRRAARSRRPIQLAAVVLAVVGGLLAAFLLLRPAPEALERGGLAMLTAASRTPIVAGSEIASASDFSDGSRVRVAAGTRLAVLQNTSDEFVTVLASGRAEFSIKPGGSRRWVVDCGAVTIEVAGTEFAVERAERTLNVSVRHGVVLVRGDRVPDGLQRLTAGQSLQLELAVAQPLASATPSASVAPAAPVTSTAVSAAGSASSSSAAEPTVDALLKDADRARRERRTGEAAALLERSLAREPRGHRASISAFTLGRMYLDELGNPSRAAVMFQRALAAGAPGDLQEDLRARLVEAHVRMGDSAGAKRAADAYRSRFPSGRRRADVDRLSPLE